MKSDDEITATTDRSRSILWVANEAMYQFTVSSQEQDPTEKRAERSISTL